MKLLLYLILIAGSSLIYLPGESFSKPALENRQLNKFDEGILHTKVSFPGNVLNDFLAEIDFSRSDIVEQMKNLQSKTNSIEYAEKIEKKLSTLSDEEKNAMGKMMMGIMLSPLYAKIYVSETEVLARASAINYTMESYMDNTTGKGRMNVMSNMSDEKAAIEFSAGRMKEVWEKEEVGPSNYSLKEVPGTTTIAGFFCNQTVYTNRQADKSTAISKAPYKLIVWHSNEIGREINFFHPFYVDLNKGILKIEVHYDKLGKVKMIYEVTSASAKKLSENDFTLTSIQPVLNWDVNPAEASIKILQAMMASNE